MINYQNKCRLIRGWDDLFNKLKENINQVATLPFFQKPRQIISYSRKFECSTIKINFNIHLLLMFEISLLRSLP